MIHKSFVNISWERIDEIVATTNKTVLYLNTIRDFSNWVDNNLANLDVEQVISIYVNYMIEEEEVQVLDQVLHLQNLEVKL